MKTHKTLTGIGLLCLLVTTPLSAAEFRAHAPVLRVEPVMETRYTPVTRQVCTLSADARPLHVPVAHTIAADIRAQLQYWQRERDCRSVTEQSAHEAIVAYRVTYRYGEETRTVRMAQHPGEHIPVTVSLSPLH